MQPDATYVYSCSRRGLALRVHLASASSHQADIVTITFKTLQVLASANQVLHVLPITPTVSEECEKPLSAAVEHQVLPAPPLMQNPSVEPSAEPSPCFLHVFVDCTTLAASSCAQQIPYS